MSRKLRIAHVVGNLETGGMQALVIELMHRLDRDRFDPFLIHFKSPNHFKKEIKEHSWECHKLKASRSYRQSEIKKLAQEIDALKPDIVHTHSDFANFAGRAAAIACHVPHIIVHYQNTYEHRMNDAFKRMESLLAARTDAYIACSEGVEQYLAENLDLKGRPVHLFENCVDIERYKTAGEDRQAARQKLNVPEDVFHLVHTARLEPHKQPQQLLKALSLSTRDEATSLGNWRLTLVGSGSLEKELPRIIDELDVSALKHGGETIKDRVHFAGWSKDIDLWLATADLFCLVSKNEGLPLSLVEAMAAGSPVIAPDVIGPQEVLKKSEYGLLVNSADEQEILKAILRLRNDDDFRNQMITKGKERAEDYSVVQLVDRLSDFYESVASEPGLNQSSPIGVLEKNLMLFRLRRAAQLQKKARKRA